MEKLLPASRFLMIFDNVSRNVVEKDKPREISINPFQIQAYAAVFVSYLLNFELITKLGKWMTFPQDRTLTLTQNKALTMMIDESSDDSATSSLTQLYQRDNESVPKFHRRVAKVIKVFISSVAIRRFLMTATISQCSCSSASTSNAQRVDFTK